MNPLNWKREHKIALVLSAMVGAALLVPFGFIVMAAGRGAEGYFSFGYWLDNPVRFTALYWGLFGAVIGAAVTYIKQLQSQ